MITLPYVMRDQIDGCQRKREQKGMGREKADTWGVVQIMLSIHTACKDEFRQHIRSHSCSDFLFLYYIDHVWFTFDVLFGRVWRLTSLKYFF